MTRRSVFAPALGLLLAFSFALQTSAGTLVGSLMLQGNPSPQNDQQSHTGLPTRTTGGSVETRGDVAGSVSMMSGHEVGASSYNGIDISSFSVNTQYKELNRFASDVAGGLIAFDFDLSGYLAGKTVGNSAGDSSFSLDVDFTSRRTSGGKDGLWYLSYNGGGLTLDSSDITAHTVSGATSGAENYALVTDATQYKPVLSLAADAGSGMESVDITGDIATIAAGDGLIRIAYLEREFRGDIVVQGVSGLVESVAIPEPGSAALVALIGVAIGFRRRV
ncbi:hypothetical protein MalM25_04000 [Planctomycetes bacterium MalM25]|nr:hypothetical protein MalM25_04000 [Planctomycetes bacterium MalM25]